MYVNYTFKSTLPILFVSFTKSRSSDPLHQPFSGLPLGPFLYYFRRNLPRNSCCCLCCKNLLQFFLKNTHFQKANQWCLRKNIKNKSFFSLQWVLWNLKNRKKVHRQYVSKQETSKSSLVFHCWTSGHCFNLSKIISSYNLNLHDEVFSSNKTSQILLMCSHPLYSCRTLGNCSYNYHSLVFYFFPFILTSFIKIN